MIEIFFEIALIQETKLFLMILHIAFCKRDNIVMANLKDLDTCGLRLPFFHF